MATEMGDKMESTIGPDGAAEVFGDFQFESR